MTLKSRLSKLEPGFVKDYPPKFRAIVANEHRDRQQPS